MKAHGFSKLLCSRVPGAVWGSSDLGNLLWEESLP